MIRWLVVMILSTLVTVGCGTTDSALKEQGRSQSYITGFHDGRHSGSSEAGNNYEQFIKDTERYKSDTDYQEGWLAGEVEGKKLQAEAEALGNTAAGAYGAHQIGKEVDKNDPDKVAKDAVKGINKGALKSLE